MKSLGLSVWVWQQIKEKYQNGCHLKTTSQNHKIFDVHMWGTYMCGVAWNTWHSGCTLLHKPH